MLTGCGPVGDALGPYLEVLGINKGGAALKKIEQRYSNLKGVEVTANNVESFYTYKIELTALARVYKGEESAKQALSKIAKVAGRAESFKSQLIEQLEKIQQDSTRAFKTYSDIAGPVESKVRVQKPKPFGRPDVKAGQCLVTIHGSEFDSPADRLKNFHVSRVKKVGKD